MWNDCRLAALLSCIDDGLACLSPDWLLTWRNRALDEMLALPAGGPPVALIGLFASEPSYQSFCRDLDYLAQREERVRVEVNLKGPGGESRPVAMVLARCANDPQVAWVVSFRDVGEVASLRHRLAERERSQSFLKAGTSDLIVRTNASFIVTWCNDAAGVLFRQGDDLRVKLARACQAEMAALAGPESEKIEIEWSSAEGAPSAFTLKGMARRLVSEEGEFAGVSIIGRDESDGRRLGLLSERLGLSPREEDVLRYLASGYSNLNISAILGLSESGVKFHVRNILAKAKVGTRTELMSLMLSL